MSPITIISFISLIPLILSNGKYLEFYEFIIKLVSGISYFNLEKNASKTYATRKR